MSDSIFKKLREQLDQYSIGFPATKSGVEIRILRELFSEKDALLFNHLTAQLEPPAVVAQRAGRPAEAVSDQLESMAARGLAFRKSEAGTTKYSAAPFIHGLLEFQLNHMDQRLIKLVGEYINERLHENLSHGSTSFMRIIPVRQSLQPKVCVAPFDDAAAILTNEHLIVVTPCACRSQVALFGKDCDKPKEVCFMFGPMAQYYLDNHLGRAVDLEEALAILSMANEAGLITQPSTAQRPFTMCNCCGCCCGFLRPVNKLANPADYVFSNYTASVWPDRCSGCGTCVERCQMHAITINESGCSEIQARRCIGCGLCVTTCPEEAIELVLKTDGRQRIPPLDTAEQMRQLSLKRGKDVKHTISFGF